MKFLRRILAYTASMFLVLGAVAIIIGSVAMAFAVHWVWALGLLLVPLWLAALDLAMDWSLDIPHRR